MLLLSFKKTALLIGDVALLYIALYLTLLIRYRGSLSTELWLQHLAPFTILFIIWIVVFFINNLYAVTVTKNDMRFYSYLIQNLILNTVIGFTFFYLSPASLTSLRPLRVLVILVLIYVVLFLLWRNVFYRLTGSNVLSNRLLLIGVNQETMELAELLQKNPHLGYSLTLLVNLDHASLPPTLQHIPLLRDLTDLPNAIRKYKIQTVVTTSSVHAATVSKYLFETLSLGISYFNFPTFYEKLTGKIPVASLEKTWFLENLLEGNKKMYEIIKRTEDIVFILIFGSLSLLLVPFIALGVKLTSPGPIVFKQTRTGKGGKNFTAMKFRTMVTNAEAQGPQWATKNDARVTSFGRFLRKSRLDEIPQFINILKGDMSFVGPRPERPEFFSMLASSIPYYKERLLVQPGLSGWAQINFKYGESVEDAMTKLQYDLFYIKNRSFALDTTIILKTISTVLSASLGQ